MSILSDLLALLYSAALSSTTSWKETFPGKCWRHRPRPKTTSVMIGCISEFGAICAARAIATEADNAFMLGVSELSKFSCSSKAAADPDDAVSSASVRRCATETTAMLVPRATRLASLVGAMALSFFFCCLFFVGAKVHRSLRIHRETWDWDTKALKLSKALFIIPVVRDAFYNVFSL